MAASYGSRKNKTHKNNLQLILFQFKFIQLIKLTINKCTILVVNKCNQSHLPWLNGKRGGAKGKKTQLHGSTKKTKEGRANSEEGIFHLSVPKIELGKPTITGDRVKFCVFIYSLLFESCEKDG